MPHDGVTASWRQPVLSILCFIYLNVPGRRLDREEEKHMAKPGFPVINADLWNWPEARLLPGRRNVAVATAAA